MSTWECAGGHEVHGYEYTLSMSRDGVAEATWTLCNDHAQLALEAIIDVVSGPAQPTTSGEGEGAE